VFGKQKTPEQILAEALAEAEEYDQEEWSKDPPDISVEGNLYGPGAKSARMKGRLKNRERPKKKKGR